MEVTQGVVCGIWSFLADSYGTGFLQMRLEKVHTMEEINGISEPSFACVTICCV